MQKNACSVSLSLRKRRLTAIIFCLLSAFTLPIPLQAGVPFLIYLSGNVVPDAWKIEGIADCSD